MWVVDRIGVSELNYVPQEKYVFFLPCLDYNTSVRSRFRHIWLRLRELETGKVHEVQCSRPSWGRIDTVLDMYKPYGYVPGKMMKDKHRNCFLVAVDNMSYQFLSYVDGFSIVNPDLAPSSVKRLFGAVNVMSFADENRTLGKRSFARKQHWYFPLMQLLLHVPSGWCDDEYYFLSGSIGGPLMHINFCDKQKAKALLAKASLVYGGDIVADGVSTMGAIFE